MGKTGEHTIDFSLRGNGPDSRFQGVLATLAAGLAKRILNLNALNDIYRDSMRETDDAPSRTRCWKLWVSVICWPNPIVSGFPAPPGDRHGQPSFRRHRRHRSRLHHALGKTRCEDHGQSYPGTHPGRSLQRDVHLRRSLRKEGLCREQCTTPAGAVRWVRGGGMLGIFPAGEVAHLHLRKGCITDPEWNEGIARLVRLTRASVLPVYFEGSNGPLFQLLGLPASPISDHPSAAGVAEKEETGRWRSESASPSTMIS